MKRLNDSDTYHLYEGDFDEKIIANLLIIKASVAEVDQGIINEDTCNVGIVGGVERMEAFDIAPKHIKAAVYAALIYTLNKLLEDLDPEILVELVKTGQTKVAFKSMYDLMKKMEKGDL